ncbi:hypothetical protein [Saccharothrix algeriensis]|uniref:Uncharacterized protein n=1 Tax=Saccharothrix algeriensis TaxID=173560 RepID=A0A8T8I7U1_9PSEU|nr:hypothetical protein [Saccharothrix algeriensis]MBM7810139.1 hypothetical protein [Saccharothrix algeriensis]QTR06550.1 hypothetical protein J7S33_05305 [Saccharothrix algeriensis]
MTQTEPTGPSVVWAGPSDAPVVLVLDPAGAAPHGELPATWRPLTEHLQVVWCRLPVTDDPLREAEVVLAELRDRRVHLVAGAAAGADVGELADRHREQIRSVQTFAAPLPLGHPDVVMAVLEKLLAQDVVPPDAGLDITEGGKPAESSLLGDAATALWQSVYQVAERLKRG